MKTSGEGKPAGFLSRLFNCVRCGKSVYEGGGHLGGGGGEDAPGGRMEVVGSVAYVVDEAEWPGAVCEGDWTARRVGGEGDCLPAQVVEGLWVCELRGGEGAGAEGCGEDELDGWLEFAAFYVGYMYGRA